MPTAPVTTLTATINPVAIAAPTAPAPVVLPTTTVVQDIAWIKGHILVCLLAIALIAGSIIGGIALFESLIERHDARVAAAQQQKEGVDTATESALLAQLVQDHQADESRDAAQNALILSLVSQMKQQQAATTKQVTSDATLDAQDAASRLAMQTKASAGDVTAVNNVVTLSLPITRVVVADLDLYAQSQLDVENLQAQENAQETLTSDASTELAAANQVIAADKAELVATVKADDAACTTKVAAQKATDRKHGIWAAIGGFVGGVVLRSLI